MNDKETQTPLVFTLFEDEVRPPEAEKAEIETEAEDWEQALLRVRQQRRAASQAVVKREEEESISLSFEELDAEAEAISAAAVAPAPAPVLETVEMEHILNSARRRKLDSEQQRQVQQAYLHHWQQQHNEQQAAKESTQTDVIFAEDWLRQQGKVSMARQDAPNEHATVWINRQRQTRVVKGQSILDKLLARERQEQDAFGSEKEDVQRPPEAAMQVDWSTEAEKIVLLNIYQPHVRSQNPLVCLSEKDLLERLSEKLRPHLSDAVAGMVRNTVQRKQAAMMQDLQQALLDGVPQLVDDVLNHNLARALMMVKKEQQLVDKT